MAETAVVGSDVLRRKGAANFFKSVVLGAKNVAGKHQTQAMINAMPTQFATAAFFDKTWKTWFGKGFQSSPQDKSVAVMDQIARVMQSVSPDFDRFQLPSHPHFYAELSRGGLMARLLQPTEAADRLAVLIARANEYEPLSALHLHFDALDAAAWLDGFGELPWVAVTSVAARRILELLHDRWGPRHGSLYDSFESDFSFDWRTASPEKKREIREFTARFKPDLFSYWMKPGVRPDWNSVGYSRDIAADHTYKLLFAFAADPKFLNERRLPIWSLDLATASLAMHALAWVDRYNTMASGGPEELHYWCALHAIFFAVEPIDTFEVGAALECSPANWQQESLSCLIRARESYHSLLHSLDISPLEISAAVTNVRRQHPLIYR